MENKRKMAFYSLTVARETDGVFFLCTDMDTEQLVTPYIWLCLQKQKDKDWHTLHMISIGLTDFLASTKSPLYCLGRTFPQ